MCVIELANTSTDTLTRDSSSVLPETRSGKRETCNPSTILIISLSIYLEISISTGNMFISYYNAPQPPPHRLIQSVFVRGGFV